jgi:glycosyltransferase involved in cell wall biosynthesis
LLEAVRELAKTGYPVRLRLAGKISQADYGQKVKTYIRQNGLADSVVLLGSLDSRAVQQEIATAGLFALLSLEEGAPMGIAEAMAAGVPVVTSNRCGMPYMVRNAETGFLVEPRAPDVAGARIKEILTCPSLATSMSCQARNFALERFHPDRVATRTATVYRDIVAQSSQRACRRVP